MYMQNGSTEGVFLFGRRFEDKWTVSTAERQLTYPEDSPKVGTNTYAEDGSSGGEGGFNTVGGSGAICFYASICIFEQLWRLYKSEHNLKTMLRLRLLVHT